MPTPRLTNEIIEAAIEGFEAQKLRMDAQIAELRATLTGTPASRVAEPKAHKSKRKFSAEALKRMREAQQRRWAKVRGESAPPAPTAPEPAKPKRTLSKAGRANIVAALKKRWAKEKAAKKAVPVSKKTAAKKAAVTAPSAKAAKKAAPAKKVAAKKTVAKKTATTPTPAVAQTAE
jgi:hypothetical protein